MEVLQERTEEILRSIDDLIQVSWPSIASTRSSYEALDNQINVIKNGDITKPGGGAYKPAKISAAVDMNTGDISFKYNGANIDDIFLNTKFFNNGAYAEPCGNCKITFKDFGMPNK